MNTVHGQSHGLKTRSEGGSESCSISGLGEKKCSTEYDWWKKPLLKKECPPSVRPYGLYVKSVRPGVSRPKTQKDTRGYGLTTSNQWYQQEGTSVQKDSQTDYSVTLVIYKLCATNVIPTKLTENVANGCALGSQGRPEQHGEEIEKPYIFKRW